MCSSSGDSVVSIQYLVYVTLTVWYAGLDIPSKPAYQTVRVTYTRYHIDTTESPDDEHLNAQNMWGIEINIYKKELCIKLVIK